MTPSPALPQGGGSLLQVTGVTKRFGGFTALDAVGKRVGGTPAQVSLAWSMAQPSITAPIVSATSVAQLDDIAGAARVKLDAQALNELDTASR